MSSEQTIDPIQDLESRIRNARAELHSADIEFRDVTSGIAKALQQQQEDEDGSSSSSLPQLEDDVETETSNAAIEALANYYMDQLREIADRHTRAADLVCQDDVAQLRAQLAEEDASWVGEGGDDFSAYLRDVAQYCPQPKATARGSGGGDSDEDNTDTSRTGAGDESGRRV